MRNPARVCLCLVGTLCYGQTHAQAPLPTATYHSDAMNLDFSYPSSFTNQGDTASKDNGKSPGAGKNCVSTPVAAMDMRKGFNMIFLRRFDGACIGREITAERSSVAVNFLNDSLTQLGKPELSKGTDYEISGHLATAVSGTVKLEGVKPAGTVIYSAASCTAIGKDLACFAFLSSDCPTLAALSASTVKFADTAAAPVIPDNLALPCKPRP